MNHDILMDRLTERIADRSVLRSIAMSRELHAVGVSRNVAERIATNV